MLLEKKNISKFIAINFLISLLLLFGSLLVLATVIGPFERGYRMSELHNWFFDLAGLIARYLVSLVHLLPENTQKTSIGGIVSYLSAFVMTIPITALLYLIYWKISKNRKRK